MKDLESLTQSNIARFENSSINQRITNSDAESKANIIRSSEQRPKLSMRLEIDLTVAATAEKPYLVSQPFNGYYVEGGGTSDDAEIKLSYGGIDKYSTDNYTLLGRNDSAYSQAEIKQATLQWPAQSGKTLVIIFYLGVDFRPGSLVSELQGGVTIIDGTSINGALLGSLGTATSVALSGTAEMILTQDDDRKTAVLYNLGTDAWVGNSAVVSGSGDFWPSASWKIFRNTAAIYAITAGGASVVTGTVEK